MITIPTTQIYHTSHESGPIVTFHHEEHVDLFGFQCVDCHVKENCGYCHDLSHPNEAKQAATDKHDLCSKCHEIDNCSHCHDTQEKPAFDHAVTGWPLSSHHDDLGCRSCHPTGEKITELDNQCISCHGGWSQSNFRHSVTGLMLDETHREWDCTDCHPDKDFKQLDCSGCHDDDITPNEFLPGERVN